MIAHGTSFGWRVKGEPEACGEWGRKVIMALDSGPHGGEVLGSGGRELQNPEVVAGEWDA